jgi:Uma2 family endonuclease
MISRMATLVDIEDAPEHLVMYNVSWEYYEQTLKEIGQQHIRVAYLDGVMEFMSPLPSHENAKKAIGDLIAFLTYECGTKRKSLGSTTFRSKKKAAGSEPDECFFFNEIESLKGMSEFDPAVHRAPDLWVEVDLFSPSVPREPIYARLGVPEIWRYGRGRLVVRKLVDGKYVDSANSLAFPFLPIDAFASFIPKMIEDDETAVLTEFRDWVRSLPR